MKSSFDGNRLRVARLAHALNQSELAERAETTSATISRLENGKLNPTYQLLLTLADVLDVLPEYFERPVVDEFTVAECSFRHLQSTPRRLLDQTMARGTLLQEWIAALATFAEFPPINVPHLRAATGQEIEEVAASVRQRWDLGLAGPIVNTIRVAEHAGIVVTRTDGADRKVDAFSRFGTPPVIVLASVRGSSSRDRWNVIHEIGHLVMHRGLPIGDAASERAANRFAAAFLMPAVAFANDIRALMRIDWPHLFELKRRWNVPSADLLNRALDLRLVSPLVAKRLFQQHSYRGWNKAEPYEQPDERPEVMALALRIAEADAGETPAHLAQAVGWGSGFAGQVTGLPIAPIPQAPGSNIARIADYLG